MDINFLNTHDLLRKYCKNSSNSIEDPIFTGFTFDIDRLHSPLFYSVCEQEFTDSLRSPGGMDTKIAEEIEEKLKHVNDVQVIGSPNTYEILTVDAKNPFGSDNRRKPGYGLWENHYIDNVLYGATDYIYMVDKVSIGTYSDDSGVTDLGNGTPNLLDTYSDILNSVINDVNVLFDNDKDNIKDSENTKINELVNSMKENPDKSVNLTGYASKVGETDHNKDLSRRRVETVRNALISNGIESSRITTIYKGETNQFSPEEAPNRVVTCRICSQEDALDTQIQKENDGITQEMKDNHTKNEEEYNSAKESYEAAVGPNSTYVQKKKEIENIKKDIEKAKSDINDTLSSCKEEISSKVNSLKREVETNKLDEIKSSINNIWSEFVSLIEGDNNMYNSPSGEKKEVTKDNIKATFRLPSEKEFDSEEKSIRNEIDKDGFDTEIKKIVFVTKSKIDSINIDELNNKLNGVKEDLRKEEDRIFGTHPDGTLGSERNPAQGSLCYNYIQAENKYKNDDVSKKEYRVNELNDIKNNLDAINDYQDRGVNRVSRVLPSSDYVDPKKRNTRELFEIPQTVYDMMGFINDMNKIINQNPYVFQTITGLDEAYNKYFEIKDPYMGSGDNKISIECLEFLDLRVTAMFNKYFNAAYDRQYRRERVPINLRRFNCSIFVHDIRNFKNSINNPNVKDSGDLYAITEFALNYISAIEFKFFDCEIVPSETGGLFESVTNLPSNDARKTKFTFTYGNCVINFLPFEDLRHYVLDRNIDEIKPGELNKNLDVTKSGEFETEHNENKPGNSYVSLKEAKANTNWGERRLYTPDDGNFRRWFDKSVLGNVNNNDYRDYIRHDSSVAVDDHYKTKIVNNFALGSVVQKNQELTAMDDALRRIVTGISASTGIPVKGVVDALDLGFINPILNDKDKSVTIVKNLGNANNSKVIDTNTMEHIGKVIGEKPKETGITKDLGNVHNKKV